MCHGSTYMVQATPRAGWKLARGVTGGKMHKIILASKFARERAHALVERAPPNFVVSIDAPKRTLDQNRKMQAMLTDISVSKPGGERFTPEEWKERIMHACGWECQFLPGILDGRPFPTGYRSSRMTKAQMSAMIDWMQAWGDEQGVRWTDQPEQELAA